MQDVRDLPDDLDQFEFFLRRPAWHSRALCRGADPDIYFPRRNTSRNQLEASMALCRSCPVRWDCLESGMVFADEYGIWGGFGEVLRGAIRGELGLVMGRPNYDPEAIQGNRLRPDVKWKMIQAAKRQDRVGKAERGTKKRRIRGNCA